MRGISSTFISYKFSRGGLSRLRVSAPVLLVFGFLLAWVNPAQGKRCQTTLEVSYDYDQIEPQGVLPATPATAMDFAASKIPPGKCGVQKGLEYIDVYRTNKSYVTIGGDKFEFIPLLLTDKWVFDPKRNCYAVKILPACVRDRVKQQDGSYDILLSALPDERSLRKTIRIEANGRVVSDSSEAQFFIVPFTFKRKPLPDHLQNEAEKTSCAGVSAARCRLIRSYAIEWFLIERLRTLRRPAQAKTVRAEDVAYFNAFINRQMSTPGKTVTDFIVRNEISDGSAYALTDAILGSSGISFGAHQIDMYSNTKVADRQLFYDALTELYGKSNVQTHKDLLDRVCIDDPKERKCRNGYRRPLREFRVKELAMLYGTDWALIDAALRAPAAKDRYNNHFLTYIKDSEVEFQRYSMLPIVRRHPWLGFYLMDVDNQQGQDDRDILLKELRSIAVKLQLNNTASPPNKAEGDDIKASVLKFKLADGWGSKKPCDVFRRVENVITTVAKYYKPPQAWPGLVLTPDQRKQYNACNAR